MSCSSPIIAYPASAPLEQYLDKKLLLLELNEVPYRVLDKYCSDRPDSMLARVLRASTQYVTHTEDRLALDPWISWPTLHRGVNDEVHGILHLGQPLDDLDRTYPPIWRMLRAAGLSVGVFGSLHSSYVPPDVTDYSFYVPDYFDATAFAHPAELLSFQELNLAMTRESARNVTRKIPLPAVLRFFKDAPSLGLRLSTLGDAAAHLVRETFDNSLRVRRRAYQPLIMADLFIGQLERAQPDFATFYTNHVAAAMHRYWGAAFPQDYREPLEGEWIRKYSAEITFAMDKLDSMLRGLVRFIERHPQYVLLVASSMGQAAIPTRRTLEFLTVTDIARFMAALGVPPEGWRARPAMVPCRSVVVQEPYRDAVASALAGLTIDGATARLDKRPVAPLSYDAQPGGGFQFFVQFDSYGGPRIATLGGQRMKFEDAGLGMMPHEDGVNCTAQHVPEGSLFIYRPETSTDRGMRSNVSTADVAPSILRFFGLTAPAYMRGQPSIRLDS